MATIKHKRRHIDQLNLKHDSSSCCQVSAADYDFAGRLSLKHKDQ